MASSKAKRGWLIVTVVVLVLLAACLLVRLCLNIPANRQAQNDLQDQLSRIEALRVSPNAPVDEQSLANFNLATTNPKINEIQSVNSHNSYRKYLSPFFENFYSIFTPKMVMDSSRYGHGTLTAQLDEGVRGLELDVRYKNGAFEVFHMPVKDNGSQAPNFLLALEELLIWSNQNPNHIPITVLIEYKRDRFDLAPMQKKPTAETFATLNQTVQTAMGDKLLTPKDIRGDYPTMAAALAANNWPTYQEAKGKFMFLLHYDDEFTPMLLETPFEQLALFPSVNAPTLATYQAVASHVIHNTPDATITRLVARGYMVRTRLDEQMQFDEERKKAAIESGAQLLSTDFLRSCEVPKGSYFSALASNRYYIIRNQLGR